MLLEIAIADAYGQAFEFIKNPESYGLKNELSDGLLVFQQNPRYSTLKPGYFTDDTIKTITSFRLIKNYSYEDLLNPRNHFREIHNCFWLFYRQGWSGKFQHFMESNKEFSSDYIFEKLVRRNTNGALMGALPLGLNRDSISEIKNIAAAHALATHSFETIPYVQALALMSWYLTRTNINSCDSLYKFLLENVEGLKFFNGDPNKMTAADTFNVVYDVFATAIALGRDMPNLITKCVALGGDTDSIASLAAGLYSLSSMYKDLYKNLSSKYGSKFLEHHLPLIEGGNKAVVNTLYLVGGNCANIAPYKA